MFAIAANGTITLTRGDTAIIDIAVRNPDGTAYALSEGDTLTFTVKRNIYETAARLTKTGETVMIEPSDTSGWAYGSYVYDVQLTLADGTVNTIVGPNTIRIEPEVTT